MLVCEFVFSHILTINEHDYMIGFVICDSYSGVCDQIKKHVNTSVFSEQRVGKI